MANPKKTYFLTPSFDYPPPPIGPIRLGNILIDPTLPDRPLNPGSALIPPPAEALITTVKSEWKSTLSKSNKASIGLYAKFLDLILGAGADASTNWERGKGEEYAFDRLETTFFDPATLNGYLESAVKAPNVGRYVEKSRLRKPVYIITGLKIVRGAKAKSSKKSGHGGTLSVGLDGAAMAAPVEAGPELGIQSESEEGVKWSASDDFVFAYRVSKVKMKKRNGEVKEEEYTKGALYGLPSDESKESSAVFDVDTVEGDEAVAAEFGGDEIATVVDEDGECVCVLP
ncbi:uncharacterized protein BDR25DRAFT_376386 [Lindgomyces ingoldianus]|uniref:Uncharacterized protein n=1 Tax=Lindgomyces ingoldianus TaxID=673940 RepID=A0ACB6QL54_9PLEO|nr:uncharacterized protein BDR25DRAFT_376386 [Lindgomyces ingoldianus]KAF2466866.1 hypothetical protein BDR25DRAFT_376386 [Lindgomyces ingoldianus]